jgi:hypothetical protein
VQRTAAVTFICRQAQMIDEDREGREREVFSQDDPNAQRHSRSGQR